MYNDATMVEVDLANLEFGTLNPYTDMNPMFYLCLHNYWIHFIVRLGEPGLMPGMSVLFQPTKYEGNECTDYFDVEISDPPFVHVPTSLEFAVLAHYSQLDTEGQPYAPNRRNP